MWRPKIGQQPHVTAGRDVRIRSRQARRSQLHGPQSDELTPRLSIHRRRGKPCGKAVSRSQCAGRDDRIRGAAPDSQEPRTPLLGTDLMSDVDDEHGRTKRAYLKMPAELELRFLRELAENIRLHKNKRYDLVRERDEYAPYVGRVAGAAGKQRFNRLKASLVEPGRVNEPGASTPPPVKPEPEVWAEDPWPRSKLGPAVARELAPGEAPVLLDLTAIGRVLADARLDIERIRQVALTDDPSAPGGRRALAPKLLLQAIRAAHESVERHMRLVDRVHALLSNNAFSMELFEFLREVLVDDPKKHEVVESGVQRLIRKHGSAPPPSSGR